jgi:hypothetical protein
MKFYLTIFAFITILPIVNAQCDVKPFTVTVITADGTPLQDIIVKIQKDQSSQPLTVVTDQNGKANIGTDRCVTLTFEPSSPVEYLAGISILDLVRIQRHILGLQHFKHNANIVAADANNDRRVTAGDLSELRKLILGITSQLPSPNYRFFTEYELNAPGPIFINDIIELDGLNIIDDNINVYYVKTGDILE